MCPPRDLRNDVSGVLRRVEAGERLRVTVSGRAVAELVPLPPRPCTMAWEAFMEGSDLWQADPALAQELAALLLEMTAAVSPVTVAARCHLAGQREQLVQLQLPLDLGPEGCVLPEGSQKAALLLLVHQCHGTSGVPQGRTGPEVLTS